MLGDVIETSLSGYAVKRFPDRIEMFDVHVVEERMMMMMIRISTDFYPFNDES
jgi:hypothetical protein